MSLPLLPIGNHSFRDLRQNGNLYVDKTQCIYEMISEVKYNFLLRPPRFGKSLLLSTLAELFQGNRELFDGLWVADHWDWAQKHPVILLTFNDNSYQEYGLSTHIAQLLQEHATRYGLSLPDDYISVQFRWLIKTLSEKYGRVVLLIDEFDKPILDFLTVDAPKAEEHRNVLSILYSVLKPLDDYLHFMLLTGVSLFTKISLNPELNNLYNLTPSRRFHNLTGITQQELAHYFAGYLDKWAPDYGGKAALLEKMAEWYNGYSWGGTERLYNPYSVMKFCFEGKFHNYWLKAVTPALSEKILKRVSHYTEKIQSGKAFGNSLGLGMHNFYAVLFQTGYMTIKAVDNFGFYTFGYPNKEVRHSLLQYLLAEVVHEAVEVAPVHVRDMTEALQAHDPAKFVASLNALFATIP